MTINPRLKRGKRWVLKREIDLLHCRSECNLFHNLGPITLMQNMPFDIKKEEDKGSFYIAQYPVLRKAQSDVGLHFLMFYCTLFERVDFVAGVMIMTII